MISWFDHNLGCLNQFFCNVCNISYLTLSYILDEDEFNGICNNEDVYSLNQIYKNKIISFPRDGIERAYHLGRKCLFDSRKSKSVIKQPSIILLRWVNDICKVYPSYLNILNILNSFGNSTKITTNTPSRIIPGTNILLWQNENICFGGPWELWGLYGFSSFVTDRRVLMVKKNKFLPFLQYKPIEILLRNIKNINIVAGDGEWMGIGWYKVYIAGSDYIADSDQAVVFFLSQQYVRELLSRLIPNFMSDLFMTK